MNGLQRFPVVRRAVLAASLGLSILGSQAVHASALPTYGSPGHQNAAGYAFTALETGHLWGYFAGEDAGYTSTLGLLVNGVEAASGLFANHATAVGAAHDFGEVQAGDRLTFFIVNTSGTYYSDPSRNTDGIDHVYSASFAGNAAVPGGTYVGFEDEWGGGDLDYNDLEFVFNQSVTAPGNSGTTVSLGGTPPVAPVPLPAALPFFAAALLVLGAARTLRRRA